MLRLGVAASASLAALAAIACSTVAVATTPAPAGVTPSPSAAVALSPSPTLATSPAPPADTAPSVAQVEPGAPNAIFRELNPSGPKLADPRHYRQLLSLDAIRPIYDPIIAAADEARVDSTELVTGVSIGGESRAYPIRTLRFREIVNDRLGGVPILVTW